MAEFIKNRQNKPDKQDKHKKQCKPNKQDKKEQQKLIFKMLLKIVNEDVFQSQLILKNMIMHISQNNIQIFKQMKLPCFPEFSVLTSVKLSQNRKLASVATLLRNGQPFVFQNQIKIRQIIEHCNLLSSSFRYGTMAINPETCNFSVTISLTLSKKSFESFAQTFFSKVVNAMQQINQIFLYNIFTILRLGGQTDYMAEQIVLNQGYRIREFNKKPLRKIQQMTSDLFSQTLKQYNQKQTYQKTESIILSEQIREFCKSQTTPLTTDMSAKIPVQHDDQLFIASNNSKTSTIQNPYLQKYKDCLMQEPGGKKNKDDKIRIFQKINLYQGGELKQLFSQTNSKISAGTKAFRYFNEDKKQQQGSKINRVLAIKEYNKDSKDKAIEQKNIIQAMKSYTSCYIVKYYSPIDLQKQKNRHLKNFARLELQKYQNSIVMEYYDAGCVNNVLDDLGRVGSIKTKLEIMFKIINGLRFLRDIKIVHMDLKFQNVLIARDLGVKISDFGEAINKNSDRTPTTRRTLPYTAPQFYESGPPNKSDHINSSYDTYSYGVMLDYIFKKHFILPFRTGTHPLPLTQSIKNKRYPTYLRFNIEKYIQIFPKQIARLISLIILLCMNPKNTQRINNDIIAIIIRKSYNHYIESLRYAGSQNEPSIY